MNLLQTIKTIEKVAKAIPNVNTVVSTFEDLNREDTVYSAVIIQQQSHTHNDDWMQYNFYIGYADRLVEDGSNELSVQSTAMNNIHSIARALRNILSTAEISYSNTNVFTQRFTALCAGAYETVSIILPISECDDNNEGIPGLDSLSTTITSNGDYNFVPDGLGFDSVHVVVDVQPEVSLEERSISINENGQVVVTTTPGFTGMGKVNINVDVPQAGYKEGYDEGYSKGHQEGVAEGYADGVATQKSKLQDITITENGVYDREDGYKHIVVNVPASAEAEGYTININENGTFTYAPQEGVVWNSVTVIANVPTEGGYQEGYNAGYAAGREAGYTEGYTAGKADGKAEGIAEQKAKLSSIEITANGTYEKEDGYNRVVVNVESHEVNLQEKTTNPATTAVEVTPDLGFDGLSKVTVNPVDSNIDPNIVPENIKTGVTILGVGGTLKEEKPEERFNVQPTTAEQTITPAEGKVFSGGTVKAVTAAIDNNIVAGNIKEGVTVLGVEGTFKGEKPEERFNVQPSTAEQTIIPRAGYTFKGGIVKAVTAEIDENIKSSNIREGVTVLGVEGTLKEEKPEERFNVQPSTAEQIITPREGYTFSGGTVHAVTSDIDKNIVSNNIREGITVLGVEGTLKEEKPEETFDIQPSITDQTITPSEGSVFSRGTVRAVTADIDPNIVPENIKTGVTVLGVAGILKEEKPEETFNVQPSTVEQTITPTAGSVFSRGTVRAVTSSIDGNIQPENIREGVTVLGVEGTLKEVKPEETFNIQPTTTDQTITPTEGSVFSRGTVRAVTSSIDSNIQPENIREGVTVLGVAGTLKDVFEVPNGMRFGNSGLTKFPSNFDFSNVTNMTEVFAESFIEIIPRLNTQNAASMRRMFAHCPLLATVEGIDFSGLTSDLIELFGSSTDMIDLKRFIVNGKINVSISDNYSIKALTRIDYDSVKSILEAANRTDNTNKKTLAFNREISDPNRELAALVASCTSKGWTITGLTRLSN